MDKTILKEYVEKWLEPRDMFLVDLTVSADNDIVVDIDSAEGITIDDCEALSRAIEEGFDREVEDYSLEVGSASITDPFKVLGQYLKNIGNDVEVLTKEGKKLRGVLTDANAEEFTVEVTEKVKLPEQKKPVIEQVPYTFGYDEIKYTKYIFKIQGK